MDDSDGERLLRRDRSLWLSETEDRVGELLCAVGLLMLWGGRGGEPFVAEW